MGQLQPADSHRRVAVQWLSVHDQIRIRLSECVLVKAINSGNDCYAVCVHLSRSWFLLSTRRSVPELRRWHRRVLNRRLQRNPHQRCRHRGPQWIRGFCESPGPFGLSSELLDLQSTRRRCDGSCKCERSALPTRQLYSVFRANNVHLDYAVRPCGVSSEYRQHHRYFRRPLASALKWKFEKEAQRLEIASAKVWSEIYVQSIRYPRPSCRFLPGRTTVDFATADESRVCADPVVRRAAPSPIQWNHQCSRNSTSGSHRADLRSL